MNTPIEKFSQSKKVRYTLIGICVLIIALVIFQAGVFVGARKASYSYGFGRGGHMMGGMGMMGFDDRYLSNGHGAVGKIIRIDLPTFVVETPENTEKVVRIIATSTDSDDRTLIRQFRENIEPATLKVNDYVVVIGSPNASSEIEAKLIRIMPTPSTK